MASVMSQGFHHVGRRQPCPELVAHEIHVGFDMIEKHLIALAEIVQPRLTVGSRGEPVSRTLAVAGEVEPASPALVGQRCLFGESKLLLTL